VQPRLQSRLQAMLPGLQVRVEDSVGSTNTALLDAARGTPAGQACAPGLVVAVEQTSGRGRMGRSWHAAPGASLTWSLALPLAPRSWDGLSLAVGLALADALDPAAPSDDSAARIGLKWPNDLWLWDGPGQGRKLGGILIETVMAGSQRVCVVGVGLNITPHSVQGAAATGTAAACLQQLDPATGAAQALERCAPALLQALLQFQHQGFAPLVAAYQRRDLLLGQPVHTLQSGSVALHGVAAGVDGDGALCILPAGAAACTGTGAELQASHGAAGTPAGVHRVRSGEVSVRLHHPATAGAVPC
jgi:BirA family biotin operon repressor/biotin-[acetyl-CoA-carboxylase] ligase